MNDRQSKLSALVSLASGYIHETFVVTPEQASAAARGLVELIDSQGGDAAAFDIEELKRLIDKDLGKRYEWKHMGRKEAAIKRNNQTVEAYNAYLDSNRKSPFKKW
jgi:hypothetical protein